MPDVEVGFDLVDDMSDTGLPVTMEPAEPVVYDCRPAALKRAIRLIDNATDRSVGPIPSASANSTAFSASCAGAIAACMSVRIFVMAAVCSGVALRESRLIAMNIAKPP